MRNLILRPNWAPRDFDAVFDNFFGKGCGFPAKEVAFMPRINVQEDDNNVRLTFELPGLDKGEIKVVVQDGVLTVAGERKLKSEDKGETFVRTEIRSGSFSRSFTLSDQIDPESVKADYSNGFLEVTLEKKEEKKPREIQVKVS